MADAGDDASSTSSSSLSASTSDDVHMNTPASRQYWVDFYAVGGAGEKPFEWYVGYDDLRAPLLDVVRSTRARTLLHIGVGNSTVGEQLVLDDDCPSTLECVDSIDYCADVMETMRERLAQLRGAMKKQAGAASSSSSSSSKKKKNRGNKSGNQHSKAADARCPLDVVRYRHCDVRATKLADASVDVVLDKGCCDAFLSTFDDETGENAKLHAMFAEMYRVLRIGGVMLIVSGNDTFLTYPYLLVLPWRVEVTPTVVERSTGAHAGKSTFYVYRVTKTDDDDGAGGETPTPTPTTTKSKSSAVAADDDDDNNAATGQ